MADVTNVTVGAQDLTEVTVQAGQVTEVVFAGKAGPTGPAGAQGAAGQGVPVGGTTGQVLGKASGTDYDTEWVDQSGGGGGGSPTKIFIGANGLINTVGSPVRARSATGSLLRWQMPDSTTTAVTCTFDVPADWTTFALKVHVMGATATTGDVSFQFVLRPGPAIVGGVVGTTNTATIPNTATSFEAAISTQWEVVEVTQPAGPFNAVAGAFYSADLIRLGGVAADTYAGALDVLGFVLEKVT